MEPESQNKLQNSNTANIIVQTFEWKDSSISGSNNDGYFVSLVDSKLVRSTNSIDVLGITLDHQNNNKSTVGLFGVMNVHDDGTCTPGKKCKANNGIATIGTDWLVLDRISNDQIRILFR
jgi:hypothetical protein